MKLPNVGRLAAGLSLAALLGAAPALAATQGTVGSTSTGSVTINATVPNLVRITNLDDINLGTWSGSGDMTGSDNVCVWSTTRKYNITATGSGAAGAFTLSDGGTNTVAYSVQWAQTSGASTGTALTSGTALTAQNTSTTSTTCSGGSNSTLIVKILDAALQAAPAASYSGTLTLVVAPE
ncbi:MAG: hypothetical protein U1F37_18320 [Alphaproteobacteria bacterium]